jgi:tetratricopeptide (TPR) repeat protein
VAVKVLLAAGHAGGEDLRRFQREAKAAARLTHPNVVQIYDVGSDGELPYFVMEYVDGCPLDRFIGNPALTLENALRLLVPVARALHAAHEQGIVHRDIKPSNILIQRSGQPKLADFGLARSFEDSQALSRTGDLVGTPRYMAPEQVLGERGAIDARTDVYALGVVMYEMLAGRPPVDAVNPLAIFRQLLDGEPADLRAANSAVPEEVAAICRQAMARDREARFATAGAFADAVQSYLLEKVLGRGTSFGSGRAREMLAALPPLPLPPARPRSRWPARAALGIGAAVVAIGLFTSAFLLRGLLGQPAPPPQPEDLSAARIRVVAQARDQLGGALALPANATPRDVLKGLLEDLTALLKRAPDDDEVRLLRARAERRAGEHLAAADDLGRILARDPHNVAAAGERLLAHYQLYVLYLGNLDEPLLRPPCLEELQGDLRVLRAAGDTPQRKLADLVEALARRDYAAAARLVPANQPSRAGLPEETMVEADALFHAADQAYAEEAAAEDGEPKNLKHKVREESARRALQLLQRGLDADPNHVGLLFLKANAFHRRVDWDAADADDHDHDAAVRRYKPAFEAACDRLRRATLRAGCDTAVARAVLLRNFGRDDQALEQVQDALSDHPQLPYLYTLRAWLRLQTPTTPDGTLTAEEVERILRELQPAFEAPPDDFNPYFVRALVLAAAGRWADARSDLRACRRQLGRDDLPTSVAVYDAWMKQAQAATAAYLYTTRDVLDTLSVPAELRLRLGQELLQRLADPGAVAQDGLTEKRVGELKGWVHFRLAQVYAQKDDKSAVLREAREALQLRVSELTPKTFRDDGTFMAWNDDLEFKALYAEYEKPSAGAP